MVITITQLKEINQIFLEHQKLVQTDSIQKNQISTYKKIVENQDRIDSLRVEELKICSETVDGLHKKVKKQKIKDGLLIGTSAIAIISLLFNFL